MGKVAAQIVIETRCPACDAGDAEVAGYFRRKHAGCFQPVARAGVPSNQLDEVVELTFKVIHELGERAKLAGVKIESHATEASHAAQQSVAGELFV